MSRGPTAVALPRGSGGLPEDSCALCHQVTTLDRAKLDTLLGQLSAELLQAVEAGLMVAIGKLIVV